MSVVDKSSVALMPGDPFRVPLVAEYLDAAREIAHKREHRTILGTYKGRDVTVTSTGLGCPSTAIAVEELARVGVTAFIRVGNTGSATARISSTIRPCLRGRHAMASPSRCA